MRRRPDVPRWLAGDWGTGIALTATSLGVGAVMLHEVAVRAADGLLGARPATFDVLVAHMTMGFAASAAGAALLVRWDRAGWDTRRGPAPGAGPHPQAGLA